MLLLTLDLVVLGWFEITTPVTFPEIQKYSLGIVSEQGEVAQYTLTDLLLINLNYPYKFKSLKTKLN